MSPKTKKILNILFAPSAFKLGILVTIAFVFLSRGFYSSAHTRDKSWILEQMRSVHQKSIDIRLKLRGPRPPSQDIAIIAVDEVAVEQLGRWPWPRVRMANMIDELVKNGAKVVGFDATFAEPDSNQATVSLTKLKKAGVATGSMATLLEEELLNANTDRLLTDSIKRNSKHVVLGNFLDELRKVFVDNPYLDHCVSALIDGTPETERLQNEEKPLAVNDSAEFILPAPFVNGVKAALDDLKAEGIKALEKEGRTPAEIKTSIYYAQLEYCSRWLKPDDEYLEQHQGVWLQSRKEVEGWETLAFENAVSKIMYESRRNSVRGIERLYMNLKEFGDSAKHSGYFSAHLDDDGTIRRSKLLMRYGSTYVPSLALKTLMVAKGFNAIVQVEPSQLDPSTKVVTSVGLIDDETGDEKGSIPVDENGYLLINYAGQDYMFPHMSVYEVLNGKETADVQYRDGSAILTRTVNKKEFLKDKMLVFGATAIGIYDLRVTPFSENFRGVETHANVLDNLVRGDFLRPVTLEHIYMEWTIAAIGLGLSLVLTHLGAVLGLLLTLASIAGITAIDKFYLFGNGHVITIVTPLLLVGTLYVALTFYKYFTEERHKKAIKGTFEKYVSPAIVAEVLKDPSNLLLGGKKQRMTVLFSDVRGFTTISEKLDPQALSAMLNSYLTPMTELVFKNKGTLDKYMGDAIMAFFGAPLHYPDHAKAGVQCALDMMALLPGLNKMLADKGLPPIDVGIGLNTGDMSVGNMGSETVRSYTVMGDAVNLGSRLEGINKQYGTHIIISEFTYLEVKDEYICREVDWVRVKGKLQPVKIFEVVSRKQDAVKSPELLSFFEKGSLEYHQQNWDTAIDCFSKALNIDPEDEPSKLFLQRATAYKEEPPPKDWDGVFEMKTK
ncbi:MAG: CHASE2 domain-containing protein [Bdellovibrionia bacterium]